MNENNKLNDIKIQISKWPDDTPISVRDLKEILKKSGYLITENRIRQISNEGQLEGKRMNNRFWIYPKSALYKWLRYLEKVGLKFLIERRIIKEEDNKNQSHIPGRIE